MTTILSFSIFSVLVLTIPNQPAASQDAAPRILVIAGEDGVNIIQQKTAVAPVIEIRDRNNLPVVGATVTFSVGNTATFAGGAQTLTVVTNAAGQAAAAGFTPVAAGAVQINVAAAVQGQALAATIVQTNVLTVAEAAGAASAAGATGAASGGTTGTTGAAAGGAAGGGGGISGTTIGIVGAAVAGGAVAATQVGGSEQSPQPAGPKTYSGTFTFPVSLTFGTQVRCTRVEIWTGTLSITLDPTQALAGTAALTSSGRVQSTECTGGPQVGATDSHSFNGVAINGTLGFSYERSNPFNAEAGGIGTNSVAFNFAGSLNGAEITGTLNHTRGIQAPGAPLTVGTASSPVTLR